MNENASHGIEYPFLERYPKLGQFLMLFYEDFQIEGDEVYFVRRQLRNPPESVEQFREELREVLDNLSEDELEAAFRQLGSDLDPVRVGWESHRAFLEQVLEWVTHGVPDGATGKVVTQRSACVRASSYPDEQTANEVVDEAIRAKSDEIREWLEALGGPMSRRRHMSDYDAGRAVGRLVERRVGRVREGRLEGAMVPTDGAESGAGSVEMDVTCVRSVFVHDPDFEHGWRVHTSYPVERVSNPFLRRRWPHLDQVLSAYFHQDWPKNYGDIAGAAIHYVRENPVAVVEATREELADFRHEFRDASEEELGDVIEFGFGAEFHAPAAAMTFRDFLSRLDGYLEAETSTRPVPGTGGGEE